MVGGTCTVWVLAQRRIAFMLANLSQPLYQLMVLLVAAAGADDMGL